MGKVAMNNYYTRAQKDMIDTLAEIEKDDQSKCDSCGGEDCCCCEIALDRSRWVEPEQLFREELW